MNRRYKDHLRHDAAGAYIEQRVDEVTAGRAVVYDSRRGLDDGGEEIDIVFADGTKETFVVTAEEQRNASARALHQLRKDNPDLFR